MTHALKSIYHVCARVVASAALRDGEYRAPSLATEGFIHMAQLHQVRGVVERYYAGQSDLVVLVVDPARVRAPVRAEPTSSLRRSPGAAPPDPSELFPHIYGPLNRDAVLDVVDLAALGV